VLKRTVVPNPIEELVFRLENLVESPWFFLEIRLFEQFLQLISKVIKKDCVQTVKAQAIRGPVVSEEDGQIRVRLPFVSPPRGTVHSCTRRLLRARRSFGQPPRGDRVSDEAYEPLTSNRAVENAAITFVLAYEKAHRRGATDTRGGHAPADVESDNRVIEVKAFGLSARGNDLWLETRQVDEARTNGRFHLYVVDNVRQGNPAAFRLIDLHGDVLARLLERARPQTYMTVRFPVGAYDAAVAGGQ